MGEVQYLLHGLQDRYSALYQENLKNLTPQDVPIASIGSAGQTYLGNLLLELGLNYVDAYTEQLHQDGTSSPDPAYSSYRSRLSGTVARDRDCSSNSSNLWPRFVKTHLAPSFFEDTELFGAWILVRDPRDALYSWYRFRTGFVQDPMDLLAEDFADWLDRPGPIGLDRITEWADFYRSWRETTAGMPHSAVTSFEALKTDPAATLRRALHAFGVEVQDTALDSAIRNSDFDRMRSHEQRGSKRAQDGKQAGIMRRGRPNEWQEWITPELSEYFAREPMDQVAGDYGYATR
jgi:hypothetical protein